MAYHSLRNLLRWTVVTPAEVHCGPRWDLCAAASARRSKVKPLGAQQTHDSTPPLPNNRFLSGKLCRVLNSRDGSFSSPKKKRKKEKYEKHRSFVSCKFKGSLTPAALINKTSNELAHIVSIPRHS